MDSEGWIRMVPWKSSNIQLISIGFFLETCLLPCSHVRTSNAHSTYISWYIQGLLSHTHVLWQFPHLLWTFGLRLCCGPHGFFKQVYPPPSISIKTNPMMRNFPMASLDLRRVPSFSENGVYQCLMIHHFPIRNCRLNPQCWTKKMPDYSRFWLVILPLLINIPISSIGSTVGLNISTGQSSYSPQKATKLGGLSHVQNISYIQCFTQPTKTARLLGIILWLVITKVWFRYPSYSTHAIVCPRFLQLLSHCSIVNLVNPIFNHIPIIFLILPRSSIP